jgi:hypothetical protein
MTAKFSVLVSYVTHCSVCRRASDGQAFVWDEGTELPMPSKPPGWRQIDREMVCPKHKVKVTP